MPVVTEERLAHTVVAVVQQLRDTESAQKLSAAGTGNAL